MEILKLENVKKIYEDGNNLINALDKINLTIYEKDIVVILGPSGSGKSTLLNIMGGILKPSLGKITFLKEDLTSFNNNELLEYRKNYVGFVTEDATLIATLTVYENILLGSYLNNNTSNLDIDDVLNILKIDHLKDKFPFSLSGGERQRVVLARSIIKNSKILLLDEPTGSLDYENSLNLINLLEKVNQKFNTTIVVVTHDYLFKTIAKRIIFMKESTIIDNKEII